MNADYDVLIIGTGTSAYQVAYQCREAGLAVAVVDAREYGGTCAMRGCQPKKYLIAAAHVAESAAAMQQIGIGIPPAIHWPDLIKSKNQFTDAVPRRTEAGFQKAGIDTLFGWARFTGAQAVTVGDREIAAKTIVIASGAIPRPLNFPGEELLTTSEGFLNLEIMPSRIVFVGGGYISFEFAHVANQAGAAVTILQRDENVLKRFEPELVEQLVAASRDAGIEVKTTACVNVVEKEGNGLVARCRENPAEGYSADIVVHGAGRVAALDDLDLTAAGIRYDTRGISVNAYMQSVSNPAVYAIGDAAASPFQLATTADMEGELAAANIVSGNHMEADYSVVPSAVFTLPPLATVGMGEAQAREKHTHVKVNSGQMDAWPSSRRIGQKHAGYKVIIDPDTDLILGAHILGHNADEVINIFALAMRFHLTTTDLGQMLWAYPTYVSDLKYMIG